MSATHEASKLPALIDRACNRLEAARTSAEVLEAKAIAEAALHYSKVTKAANETHADCLRMIVRAEMRMADEIDKGQASGHIAQQGRPKKHSEPEYLSTVGVQAKQVHEWRELRDAGPQKVETAIRSALSEGRAPTKADIRRAVRDPLDTTAATEYKNDEGESTTLYHLKRYWGMATKRDRQAFRRFINESH